MKLYGKVFCATTLFLLNLMTACNLYRPPKKSWTYVSPSGRNVKVQLVGNPNDNYFGYLHMQIGKDQNPEKVIGFTGNVNGEVAGELGNAKIGIIDHFPGNGLVENFSFGLGRKYLESYDISPTDDNASDLYNDIVWGEAGPAVGKDVINSFYRAIEQAMNDSAYNRIPGNLSVEDGLRIPVLQTSEKEEKNLRDPSLSNICNTAGGRFNFGDRIIHRRDVEKYRKWSSDKQKWVWRRQ